MAVLFPTPVGYTLNPARQAEMLQGFLNIEAAEGSTNGRLTQAQMQDYQQKHANVVDANTAVANYLSTNFNTLAQKSSESNTLSIDDLVTLRKELPTMPSMGNQQLPEYVYGSPSGNAGSPNSSGNGQSSGINSGYGSYNPATTGQNPSQIMLALFMQMFQLLASVLSSNTQ